MKLSHPNFVHLIVGNFEGQSIELGFCAFVHEEVAAAVSGLHNMHVFKKKRVTIHEQFSIIHDHHLLPKLGQPSHALMEKHQSENQIVE